MNEIIAEIEAAGLFWCVARHRLGYVAYVDEDSSYIGDNLCGPHDLYGKTPEEALRFAFAKHQATAP